MEKEYFLALIHKFLQGRATAEERQQLLNYTQYYQQGQEWDEAALGSQEAAGLRMLLRLQQALAADALAPARRRLVWKRIAAAAAVLLLLGSLYLFRHQFFPVPMEQLSTRPGERKQHVLADGTRVWLGPASTLTYPAAFSGAARGVRLQGEAFFETVREAGRPFVISSEGIETKVLGTSFNIQAYKDQSSIVVTVLTGRVRVSEKQQQIELSADQQALFDKSSGALTKAAARNVGRYLKQREGHFDFQGTPATEVLAILQRERDIRLRIQGDLSRCTFYGSLEPGESVAAFLDKFTFILHATWDQAGTTYVIHARGCG